MKKDNERKPVDPRDYRTSWRLRFRFSGEQVELVDRREVVMIAPARRRSRRSK